jgi:23S rRNA-/tRNA-specific pseudouridylate synthase
LRRVITKGNILRIIHRDEHIIYIEKNKGTTTGGSVNEKSRIMLTSNKTNNMRGLIEAIERMAETIDMTIGNKVARRGCM